MSILVSRALKCGLLACAGWGLMAAPALAERFTVECQMDRSSRVEFSPNGPPPNSGGFSYTGQYRIDTDARSVTANFTVDVEDEVVERSSRYISDVRAMDASQVVFCEDEVNECRKQDLADNNGVDGWRTVQPTVIDLEAMTISTGGEGFYRKNRSWMKTRFSLSGTCRRI
jgi:hypothetical protein